MALDEDKVLAILATDVAVAVLDGEQLCIIKGAHLLEDIRESGKPREKTKLEFIPVRDVDEAFELRDRFDRTN